MRKQTINQITNYMLIGALVNSVSVIFLIALDTKLFEFVITNFAVNLCTVLVMRDVSRKHEYICSNKCHRLRPRKTPGIVNRR